DPTVQPKSHSDEVRPSPNAPLRSALRGSTPPKVNLPSSSASWSNQRRNPSKSPNRQQPRPSARQVPSSSKAAPPTSTRPSTDSKRRSGSLRDSTGLSEADSITIHSHVSGEGSSPGVHARSLPRGDPCRAAQPSRFTANPRAASRCAPAGYPRGTARRALL